MKSSQRTFILIAVTLCLCGIDLLTGGVGLSGMDAGIFLKLRLPRMLTALLSGACLSLAGLQMQSVFRNPLADPHIMGVSAGAGTGAAAATLLIGASLPAALSGLTVAAAAFAGSLLTSILVATVARNLRNATTLLIFGVMLGFIFSAITSIIEYSASAESLKVFYSWSAGSFSGCRPMEVSLMAATLLVGAAMTLLNNKGLDIALFGDEYAVLTGINIKSVRNMALISSCLMTGAVTAFAPHLSRWITGSSVHSKVIPATMLCGASLSLTADFLSQISPAPLPVGSTMAVIGIPIIMAILFKKQ